MTLSSCFFSNFTDEIMLCQVSHCRQLSNPSCKCLLFCVRQILLIFFPLQGTRLSSSKLSVEGLEFFGGGIRGQIQTLGETFNSDFDFGISFRCLLAFMARHARGEGKKIAR